jgi:two-component system, NarL family, nitrate/nitrite response regulator NarL
VLAESYPILLEGLRKTFSAERGFRVVSCCTTGAEALRAVYEHRPDVLVLDLRIAENTAFEVLVDLASRRSTCRVVLLADHVSDDEMAEATMLGAKGVVLKTMTGDRLVFCVRNVHAGASWTEGVPTVRTDDRLLNRLTPRQLEIAELVAHGYTNAEVANRLEIKEGTVKAHLHTLYEKLGIEGRLELALFIARGLSVKRRRRPAA